MGLRVVAARRRPADRRRGLRPQRHARDRGVPAADLLFGARGAGRWTPRLDRARRRSGAGSSCCSRCSTATACGWATWSPAPWWSRRRSQVLQPDLADAERGGGPRLRLHRGPARRLRRQGAARAGGRAAPQRPQAMAAVAEPHPHQDRLGRARPRSTDADLPHRLLRRACAAGWRAGCCSATGARTSSTSIDRGRRKT